MKEIGVILLVAKSSVMIIKDFLPAPQCRSVVQLYRIVHFEFGKEDAFPFKAYPPKPEEVLHFLLRDGEQIQQLGKPKKDHHLNIVLLGQITSVANRYAGKNFLNFQIVFQPTGLFKITGIPSYELTNLYLDATCVFPKNITTVYEQLQHANTYEDMLAIADKFVDSLISHARNNANLLDGVSRVMLQRHGDVSLDWLAKETCLCTKQFKRKFNESVGVNPKTYARIIRFTNAFNLKNAYPQFTWLRIAMECNYHDYQHLVKEYKDFTGLTPNELHALENNSPECRLNLAEELYKSRAKMFE